jgi:hypothetical protein
MPYHKYVLIDGTSMKVVFNSTVVSEGKLNKELRDFHRTMARRYFNAESTCREVVIVWHNVQGDTRTSTYTRDEVQQ